MLQIIQYSNKWQLLLSFKFYTFTSINIHFGVQELPATSFPIRYELNTFLPDKSRNSVVSTVIRLQPGLYGVRISKEEEFFLMLFLPCIEDEHFTTVNQQTAVFFLRCL